MPKIILVLAVIFTPDITTVIGGIPEATAQGDNAETVVNAQNRN
jgi:hypothetical protein